jgi:hypothetical protein
MATSGDQKLAVDKTGCLIVTATRCNRLYELRVSRRTFQHPSLVGVTS